jgi:hypothetical protein
VTGCGQKRVKQEENPRQAEQARQAAQHQRQPHQPLGNELKWGENSAHRQDGAVDKGGVPAQRVISLRVNLGEEMVQPVRGVKAFGDVAGPAGEYHEPDQDTQQRQPGQGNFRFAICKDCLHGLFSFLGQILPNWQGINEGCLWVIFGGETAKNNPQTPLIP